jgi:CRP-like cAMP-binding protein
LKLFQRIVQDFGNQCTVKHVNRNQPIFSQGSKIENLYLVQSGEVILSRISLDGTDVIIDVIRPGEYFGETALIWDSIAGFWATATKTSKISLFPQKIFKQLLIDPEISSEIMMVISNRCNRAWEQMEITKSYLIACKAKSGLLWLANKIGIETQKGILIKLNISQMAKMFGCPRENLSREISALYKLGAVEHSRKIQGKIYITNASLLGN